MNPPSPQPGAASQRWRRLWQPRLPSFWMVIFFNVVSTALVALYHGLGLQGASGTVLLMLALSNSVLGLWWARRLWRDTDQASDDSARPDA
jgi:hypothetical protein